MWLQQRNCGGSLMRKTPLHLDGTCMMQRLVTVCFTLLIVCCATTGLRAEPTLYGVTIELRSESEDSRGDILSDAKRIRIINLGPVINQRSLQTVRRCTTYPIDEVDASHAMVTFRTTSGRHVRITILTQPFIRRTTLTPLTLG
jgi:hypothetical protein